ncbi:DUF6303 family protein [Kitasatospora sp. NPDC001309]|uniref:DUF6303 family protein n=1 Tax=Kitasatospora sp. NPDC001309 TaxID=3364013 RepID=UPI0036B86444
MTTTRRPLHNPADQAPAATAPTEYRAQMYRRPGVGWVLFVAVPGLVSDWPERDFATTDGKPPTRAERDAVLAAWGYVRVTGDGGVWSWEETQESDDEVVSLSAAALVIEHP